MPGKKLLFELEPFADERGERERRARVRRESGH